jgi:hypothetical protein
MQNLLFSGQAATADLIKSAREKGHNFKLLVKPVHPRDLQGAIEAIERAVRSDWTDYLEHYYPVS